MATTTNGNKRVLTFGDFIVAAYLAWGRRRAKGLVWLAVNSRLIQFRGRQRVVISEDYHETPAE
jgi:hypothetical protein